MITNFSENVEDYILLEPKVEKMISFVGNHEAKHGPQSYYFQKGKLIKITNETNDLKYLDTYNSKKSNYTVKINLK